uniref:Uncharacterized protein n=1 Tax=Oryza punctata TaxID=4537 RepID=A0A0E0JE26_ORYPU
MTMVHGERAVVMVREASLPLPSPWRKTNKNSRLGSSAFCAIPRLNRGGGEQSRGGEGILKLE